MFLCWIESQIRDFLALEECGKDVQLKYNKAYGKDKHPREFSKKRLELGKQSFNDIKKKFLIKWPEFGEEKEIRESLERIVIYRNGFAHAQIQSFREFLLYTPNKSALGAIKKYMKCPKCSLPLINCKCEHAEQTEPLTIVFRCLDERFISELDYDLQIVDQKCLYVLAKQMDIPYIGIAWQTKDGYNLCKFLP